jgi:hypothetical protein
MRAASSPVMVSTPWTVLTWYLTQNRSPPTFIQEYVWLEKPCMFRHEAGIPRSDMRIVTWCALSGDSVQKSHCMSLERRPVSGRRFWEWMKSWNFDGSRTKKTGVLLPTMSQFPSSV